MIQILQLLLSLSILVVLHEFGHYAAARFFGCRVEKFYLFMDWGVGGWSGSLFKRKFGDTEFGIGWVPLAFNWVFRIPPYLVDVSYMSFGIMSTNPGHKHKR